MESYIVNSNRIASLYNDAKGQEAYSICFWNIVLNDRFPGFENWIVAPEQLVHRNDSRSGQDRMDTFIQYYDETNQIPIGVMLHEAKRENSSPKKTEEQAFTYARAVIKDRGLERLFVLTTIGVKFRTWYLDHDSRKLKEMFPGEKATKTSYCDAWTSDGGKHFSAFVNEIKSHTNLHRAPMLRTQSVQGNSNSMTGGVSAAFPASFQDRTAIKVHPKWSSDHTIVRFKFRDGEGEEHTVKTRGENWNIYGDRWWWDSGTYAQLFVADEIE